MSKKERLVAAIENGTVIDHIPAAKTYQVANLLELQKLNTPVTIGYNYPSKKVGSKGIIKVSDKFFTDEEISRLSVVAPKIVLNIIRDYEVVEKKTVEVSYSVGDEVRITYGPLEDFVGTVEEMDVDKDYVRVIVSMFGKETPVELDLGQVEPVTED